MFDFTLLPSDVQGKILKFNRKCVEDFTIYDEEECSVSYYFPEIYRDEKTNEIKLTSGFYETFFLEEIYGAQEG